VCDGVDANEATSNGMPNGDLISVSDLASC